MERYDTLPALTIAKILCGQSFGPKAGGLFRKTLDRISSSSSARMYERSLRR